MRLALSEEQFYTFKGLFLKLFWGQGVLQLPDTSANYSSTLTAMLPATITRLERRSALPHILFTSISIIQDPTQSQYIAY
jgi:hypothetical protein